MWERTFRFFEAGGALCVGEESRSAIRGLGARLRSLRRVAGVDMMTPGQCWRGHQISIVYMVGAATPRILGWQEMRNVLMCSCVDKCVFRRLAYVRVYRRNVR